MMIRFKGPPKTAPAQAQPWFRIPWRRMRDAPVVFGHWSALGYVREPNVLGLDTGCVWGGPLTAQRVDVPDALPVQVPNRSGALPLETD
jgi:bis(5'-nucleosyl)-tetraphosphatase (symmetrical)